MQTLELTLRCFARKQGDQWEAACLEFCLAAQGDTLEEVRAKLDAQIRSYLKDISEGGPDYEYQHELLNRRAPFSSYLTFYCYLALGHVSALRRHVGCAFREVFPLKLAHS